MDRVRGADAGRRSRARAAPPLSSPSPTLFFLQARFNVSLRETRFSSGLARPLPLICPFIWTTSRVWPGACFPHRHSRFMCLCPTLAMRGPPCRFFCPVFLRAVHHYASSTPCLYLALTPLIAPLQSIARAFFSFFPFPFPISPNKNALHFCKALFETVETSCGFLLFNLLGCHLARLGAIAQTFLTI